MPAPVEKISHYRIVARIGRGGMGVVYRAVDEKLGRQVALKLLSRRFEASPEMQARFIREARAASALSHPGIVTVHDVDAWEGRLFIVMEWIDGVSLSELAREGVSVEEALRLIADAADALGAAHATGILHRDIKSENLMRTRDGRLKVLDFGLAKLRVGALGESLSDPLTGQVAAADVLLPGDDDELSDSRARALDETHAAPLAPTAPPPSTSSASDALQLRDVTSSELTAAGAIMGTPAYMSPEQTIGKSPDVRSEVFSLGVVLYELLVGRRPFAGDTAEATMTAVHRGLQEPPSRAVSMRHIPSAVDAIVMKALAKSPENRFAGMAEMAAALRAHLTPPPPSRTRARLRAAAAIAAIAAIAVAALIIPSRRVPARAHASTSRRITFEPGCEEYPSFAPDGNTLVFDGVTEDDYELFSLDLTSGARRRLTRTSSWDYGGAVSPDGKRVAFVHLGDGGRELRIVDVMSGADGGDTSPLGLGQIAGFPTWGHDGTLIAGTPEGTIVRFDFAGLGPGAAPHAVEVTRLAPGHLLRFASAYSDGSVVAVWLPSIEATEMILGELIPRSPPRVLYEHIPYDESGVVAAWGQDGFYTAQSHGGANELFRHGRRGGTPEVVSGGVSPTAGFTISHDGKRLAYSTCRESLHVARLRPGAPPLPLSGAGPWRDRYPVVVDDHRVLFTSDRSGSNQVWLLDLKTHESHAITGADTSFPAVAPDRSTIAWCERQGIRVRPLEGGAPRVVTGDPGSTLLHFTHDGKSVIFERSDDREGARGWAAPVEGGPVHAVTPPGARYATPSPTEDRVVFLESAEGGSRVMTTDLAGSAPRPLIPSLPAADYTAPAFTPDGKSLLLVRKNVEVIEVPIDGHAPPVVRWKAGLEGIEAVVVAPDGDGLIGSLALWEGDLWMAEGEFR